MPIRRLSIPLALMALSLLAAPAGAADYVQGEVIVKYRDGISATTEAAVEAQAGTDTQAVLPGGSEQLQIEDGGSVAQTVDELREDPNVAYAAPNHIARAAQFVPNDPGARLQWNLFEEFGLAMPEAWTLAQAAGAPGGRGAVVAVLDSGVAFEHYKRFRRAPDLRRWTFVDGYDFIDDDRHPNDVFGHGTHVTGTIASTTNNGKGVAGIAYGAKIMPLRVLDSLGSGDSVAISRAIRYATRRRADVINLSLEFEIDVAAEEIPEILAAIRYAHRRGVVIVAAAGNEYSHRVAYPARASRVIAVGATTRNGCQSDYSNSGADIDITAPGGGVDAANGDNPWDLAHCRPDDDGKGDWIFQQTFRGNNPRRFGLPPGYEGTSMASPHVAAIAALVIASHKLGDDPSPNAVQDHLEATARDFGPPGFDSRYGWGFADAARALRCPPLTPC